MSLSVFCVSRSAMFFQNNVSLFLHPTSHCLWSFRHISQRLSTPKKKNTRKPNDFASHLTACLDFLLRSSFHEPRHLKSSEIKTSAKRRDRAKPIYREHLSHHVVVSINQRLRQERSSTFSLKPLRQFSLFIGVSRMRTAARIASSWSWSIRMCSRPAKSDLVGLKSDQLSEWSERQGKTNAKQVFCAGILSNL